MQKWNQKLQNEPKRKMLSVELSAASGLSVIFKQLSLKNGNEIKKRCDDGTEELKLALVCRLG